MGKAHLASLRAVKLFENGWNQQEKCLVQLQGQLVVPQLRLNQGPDYLGEEEGQDIDDTIHDWLFQSNQVVEVNHSVLLAQGWAHLPDKLVWEAQVVVISEPSGNHDPEKVDNKVVETGFVKV